VVLQVPLLPPVPRLLPSDGEGHRSGGLLQNHQQLFPGVQEHAAGRPPAEREGRASEGRGRKPQGARGQEETASSCNTGSYLFIISTVLGGK